MQKHPSQMNEDERIFLKRYLSQYYRAKERQKILRERLADIRTELNPAGKNGRNTSLAIKMAEIEDRIAQQSEIEATAILDIMEVLEFLPQDSVEREIMEMRHIDCKPWNEIMRTIHLSRAPCFRRYSTGLEWCAPRWPSSGRGSSAQKRTATKKQRPGHSSGAAHWEFPHREIPAKAPGYAPAFSFPIMDFRLTPRTPRIPCPGCRPEILRRVQGFKKAQNHTPGNKAPLSGPAFYQR